jgi:TolA-binding protein
MNYEAAESNIAQMREQVRQLQHELAQMQQVLANSEEQRNTVQRKFDYATKVHYATLAKQLHSASQH